MPLIFVFCEAVRTVFASVFDIFFHSHCVRTTMDEKYKVYCFQLLMLFAAHAHCCALLVRNKPCAVTYTTLKRCTDDCQNAFCIKNALLSHTTARVCTLAPPVPEAAAGGASRQLAGCGALVSEG